MTEDETMDAGELRRLAEAARVETQGRWRYNRSTFPNDPVNYAYVEWGERDAGYGTGTLSKPMGQYLGALSPDRVLALLDRAEAAEKALEDAAERVRALRQKDRVWVEEDDYTSGFGDAKDAALAAILSGGRA